MKRGWAEASRAYRTTDLNGVQAKVNVNGFDVWLPSENAAPGSHSRNRYELGRLFSSRQKELDGYPVAIAAVRSNLAMVGVDHLLNKSQVQTEIALRVFA
jgi:hypothetical protein